MWRGQSGTGPLKENVPMELRETSATVQPAAATGGPPGTPPVEQDQFSRALLSAMLSLKEGDFSVRMPCDLLGVNGKIADAFNDIALVSERRVRETSRVTHAVGKEG